MQKTLSIQGISSVGIMSQDRKNPHDNPKWAKAGGRMDRQPCPFQQLVGDTEFYAERARRIEVRIITDRAAVGGRDAVDMLLIQQVAAPH